MTPKICIGFGEHEGKCHAVAGTAWSPHWCERCNKLRLDHITKRLESLAKPSEQEGQDDE